MLDGNVHYVGKNATITGNSAKYFVKQKQVDATGNVNYSGKDLKVSANHVFYDEVKKIVNADGMVGLIIFQDRLQVHLEAGSMIWQMKH